MLPWTVRYQRKAQSEGKLRKIRSNDDDDDDDGINMSAEYVDPKTSRKIMQQAQAQREELATTNHDSTSSTSPLSSLKAGHRDGQDLV